MSSHLLSRLGLPGLLEENLEFVQGSGAVLQHNWSLLGCQFYVKTLGMKLKITEASLLDSL